MEFNPIRNQIRQFTYASLSNELLSLLKHQEQQPQFTAFWHPLVLLKWAMEFAEQKRPFKLAQRQDVAKLLRMVEELEMSHATFDLRRNGRVSKTFSILAFQQFTYQEKAFLDTFSRQFVLFKQLKHKYDIAAAFEASTGLSIEQLLKIFRILWAFILNDVSDVYKYHGYIGKPLIKGLIDLYGLEIVLRFINLLSVSRETIQSAVREDTRQVRDYALQVFDVSFFTRKPLFTYEGTAIVPHRAILNQTFSYFIYDYMKHRDEQFTTELGARMEKYMQAGLVEVGITHTTEGQLRKKLGREHKVVDFVIDGCVLVEAKAIELKPYVSVNPEDRLLSQELRQTIGKAYATQMLSVAKTLPKDVERYGIIVTYKDLYLGNSTDIWEQFLESETLRVFGDLQESQSLLPVENLFFMDLHTWDMLLQVLKENEVSLVSLLEAVKEADSAPRTKLMYFAMHLRCYAVKQLTHQYLVKAREATNPVD